MTNEERLAADLDSQKEYTRIWNERCNRKTEQLIEADKRIVELSEELKRLKSTVLYSEAARMQQTLVALRKELDEARSGYHALDKNWQTMHEAAMRPIRAAVGNADATVPEIVAHIERVTKDRDTVGTQIVEACRERDAWRAEAEDWKRRMR